jgi:hypothetical protein
LVIGVPEAVQVEGVAHAGKRKSSQQLEMLGCHFILHKFLKSFIHKEAKLSFAILLRNVHRFAALTKEVHLLHNVS